MPSYFLASPKQDNLTMIQIAADLAKLYTFLMEQKGLETDQHRYYIKWLRYYMDIQRAQDFMRIALYESLRQV